MDESNKKNLVNEVNRLWKKASELTPGSQEHRAIINEIVSIGKIQNADDKIEAEVSAQAYSRGIESEKIELDRAKLEQEIEKFNFEKEKFEKEQELERSKIEQARNDDLKKLEKEMKAERNKLIVAIITSGLGTITAFGTIGLKGYYNTMWQEKSFDFESNYSYSAKGSKLFDFHKMN